jgi:hypothetical protein
MRIYRDQGELFNTKNKHPIDFKRNKWIHSILATLIDRLNDRLLIETEVIKWSCPVPSFGDLSRSKTATLGLNPSNKEFVDNSGNELDGTSRRFHTLKSLNLKCWSEVEDRHLDLINDTCRAYFSRNPYNSWFKKLDYLITETNTSFYDHSETACHLDLIPYATSCKWVELNKLQRSSLLTAAADTLGLLLKNSPVKVLILNGESVVNHFQHIAEVQLNKEIRQNWELPRRSHLGVKGFSYKGFVNRISGIKLDREILVLGFNHNIQSSFGVTKEVTGAIKTWISKTIGESTYEG